MSGPVEIGRVGGYVTVRLRGDLDIANIELVRVQVAEAVTNDAHGLIIDVSTMRYIDSAGVHMLFGLARRLEARRQGLGIVVPEGSPIATLLKITNFNEVAPICGTVESCAEALRDDLGRY